MTQSRRLTRHENDERKPTNVIRVELVDANQHPDGRSPECPGHQRTEDGELALMKIVDEDGIELREVSSIKCPERVATLLTPM